MDWDQAFKEAGDALKDLLNKHGPQGLAILVSPRQTIEETFLINSLAKGLGIQDIYTPGQDTSGNHINASGRLADYSKLMESDHILCLGSNIVKDFPVVFYMIKDAVKKGGARLGIIGPESERLTDISGVWIDCEQKEMGSVLSLLSAMAVDHGLIRPASDGKDEKIKPVSSKDMEKLEKALSRGDARELLDYLINVKRSLIVVNEAEVSGEAISLLFEGIWGEAFQFLSLSKYGKDCFKDEYLSIGRLEQNIRDDRIKGIIAFGHWKGLEKLANNHSRPFIVQSSVFRRFTNGYHPDFLFPASLPLESKGSFMNAEGRLQGISEVLPPLGGKRNWEIIMDLAHSIGNPLPYKGIDEIHGAMTKTISHFRGAEKAKNRETGQTIQYPASNRGKRGETSPDWAMDEIDLFLRDEIMDLIFEKE